MNRDPGKAGRFLVICSLCLVLAACATREQRPAGAWLDERQAWFDEHPDWSIAGRVSINDGERGGSLSFNWRAASETHRIHLRTSAGGRQWRLHFSPENAVLEGSDVGRLSGPDPDPLVEEAVGWPIPLEALSWWIRGLVPPEGGRPRFAEDGTLAGVTGPLWTLEYRHFDRVEDRLLPTWLEARSDPYTVRIAIRDWRFGVEAR